MRGYGRNDEQGRFANIGSDTIFYSINKGIFYATNCRSHPAMRSIKSTIIQ